MIKILMIGDVVGKQGCEYLRQTLPDIKRKEQIDVVVANGENSAVGNGILPFSADHLFQSGVDIITGGNHTFRRREIYPYLDECEPIIRPANYPKGAPGRGVTVYDGLRYRLAVVNLLGTVYLNNGLEHPFHTAQQIISELDTPLIIVDFHAEATSEKNALGYFLDGKVSAVLGTHTHVPTADTRVLPEGTGYQTDVGMTGPKESVLGMAPGSVVEGYLSRMPARFSVADSPCIMDTVLLELDEKTGRCLRIQAHRY